jgi:antirestriction protein ArdC
MPEATNVAGYRTWQKLGRQVRKGEKGIQIMAPIPKKVEENGEEKQIIVGFRTVTVFDISQTEGEDLPRGPKDIIVHGSSESAENLLHYLTKVLIRANLAYDKKDLEERAYGMYNPITKTITLDENLSTDMEARVLVHEIVHHFSDLHLNQGNYQVNREEIEAVTESAAYVVLDHFDIDPGEASFNYIAQWGKDVEVIKQKLGDIQSVASLMISEIEKGAKVVEEVAACTSSPSPVAA